MRLFWLKYFYFLPEDIPSASAFIQQRAKLLSETFRHILTQFNLRFPPGRLLGKYSLIAADGCEFNLLNLMTLIHKFSSRSLNKSFHQKSRCH